jgi:hypothetical protein
MVPYAAIYNAVGACQAHISISGTWDSGGVAYTRTVAAAYFCDYNLGAGCVYSHMATAQFEFLVQEQTAGGSITIEWQTYVASINMAAGNSVHVGSPLASDFQHLMIIDKLADNVDTQPPVTPLMLASQPHNGIVKYRHLGTYPPYPAELLASCTMGAKVLDKKDVDKGSSSPT